MKLKRIFTKSKIESMVFFVGAVSAGIILFTFLCELTDEIPDTDYVYTTCTITFVICAITWLILNKPKINYK